MTRAWRHIRALWPDWTIVAPLPFAAYGVWLLGHGELRWDYGVVLGLVLLLFSIGPRTKRAFKGLYPVGLVGLFYSAMKNVENVGLSTSTVHVCDFRDREARWFGITVAGHRETLHDWLQLHAVPLLDCVCAIPYATFVLACIGCALWLYRRDYNRMLRFGWTFFALNVAGFVTYHLYPVAPPWYYHAHGCTVDLATRASAGPNLTRVDARLGFPLFAAMYGRASDVFGAMPSLHVAYALLIFIEAFDLAGVWLRVGTAAFYGLMCFSAVYLDHHWVMDIVAGTAYCLIIAGAMRAMGHHFSFFGPSL